MKNVSKIRHNINYILFSMHKNHYLPNVYNLKKNNKNIIHYPTIDYDLLFYVSKNTNSETKNNKEEK